MGTTLLCDLRFAVPCGRAARIEPLAALSQE
jgi:hypothetical protein